MKTKGDFIDKLRGDPLYRMALASAKSDKERADIANVVEQMVGDFGSAFESILARVQNDPEFVEQLRQSVISGESVLSDSETSVSGSAGD